MDWFWQISVGQLKGRVHTQTVADDGSRAR